MFAEEGEWSDDPDTNTVTKPNVGGCQSVGKALSKVVGKKSLQRTLQTLGAVPDWSKNEAPVEGSDSETEGTPVVSHPKKKKKRIKKRNRGAAKREEAMQTGEGEAMQTGEEASSKEKTAVGVATKPRKNVEPAKAKKTELLKGDDKEIVTGEGKPELKTEKLTRKQWRKKMKNKRHCKNKYRPKEESKDAGIPTTNVLQGPEEGLVSKSNGNCETSPQCLTEGNKHLVGTVKIQKRKKVQKSDEVTPTADTETHTQTKSTNKEKKTKKRKGEVSAVSHLTDENLHSGVAQPLEHDGEPFKRGKDGGEDEPPEPCKKRKTEESREQRRRKEKLRKLLESSGPDNKHDSTKNPLLEEDAKPVVETVPLDRSSALRCRMEQRLESARFRYINEQLYTTTSGEAKRLFKQDPEAFQVYHKGYTAQVQRWPANPVDAIISFIRHKPASLVVADFGCGDCKIARSVKNKVHSFDLAPVCDLVTVCDMAHVPLEDASVDIAVFCLSLMGTNLGDFLVEANRVLVMGGVLKIAEVASRFENVRSFMGGLAGLGFKLVVKDTENSHFYSFEFVKTGAAPEKVKKAGLELRPCVYKKR